MGIDLTPGFNLHFSPGNGVPFISRGNGTSGQKAGTGTDAGDAAVRQRAASGQTGNVDNNSGTGGIPAPAASGPVTDTGAAQDGAAYGLYTNQANDALSRAAQAWQNTQQGINQQYGQRNNELQGGLNQAQTQHDQGLNQTQQARLTATNQATQQGAQSYQSLLRMLGGMGAGGGSEAQLLVPQLVNQQVSQNLGGVGQTYAQNAQALDTNLGTYQANAEAERQKLNDWKATQLAQGQGQFGQTQQNLLQILSQLNNRAAPASDLGSAVNNVASQIPNTTSINPTYTGTTPTYTAPSLNSYTAGPTQAAAAAAPTPGGSQTPYLDMILGNQKKDQVLA